MSSEWYGSRSRPLSAKNARFACYNRQCMRWTTISPVLLQTQIRSPCTHRGKKNLQAQQWSRHPSGHALHAVTQPVADTRNDGGANMLEHKNAKGDANNGPAYVFANATPIPRRQPRVQLQTRCTDKASLKTGSRIILLTLRLCSVMQLSCACVPLQRDESAIVNAASTNYFRPRRPAVRRTMYTWVCVLASAIVHKSLRETRILHARAMRLYGTGPARRTASSSRKQSPGASTRIPAATGDRD